MSLASHLSATAAAFVIFWGRLRTEDIGQRENRRCSKKSCNRDLDIFKTLQPGNNPERNERVPAKFKKIIHQANLIYAENLSPNRSNVALKLGNRWNIFSSEVQTIVQVLRCLITISFPKLRNKVVFNSSL